MPRQNLISLIDESGALAKFGHDPAVVQTLGYRRHSRTYGEVYNRALSWSKVLASRGLAAGDRILLWGANSAEWVECFWGILLSGGIAVPIDSGAPPDFVARTVRQSGAKLLLRDRAQPEISGITNLTFNDPVAVKVGECGPGPKTPDGFTRSTLAEILFTSGTTAEPRGVVLTHGNFLANLAPIEDGLQKYLKYERWLHPLRFVSLVPLSHVFGQFMGLFVPPLLGATVVFENSPNPADILRTIKRERATAVIAVPRMLDLLRGALEREIAARGWSQWFAENLAGAAALPFLNRAWRFRRIHRLLGLRFWAFLSGGAALNAETELFFKRLGYAVVQGYGMTETASLISLNHPFSAAEGSVGKILPGREFKLAEDGEILVRGENVSPGYWDASTQKGGESGSDRWLGTGDLGELDAAGNLKFRGRKKNVIVTPAGLNVYPEDLEAALKRQPEIRDAVVLPLALGGNAEPFAVLLPAAAGGKGLEAAVATANQSLSEYQRVRHWSAWPGPDFPRTPTGKPRLAAITARLQSELSNYPDATAAPGSPGTAADDPLASLASAASLAALSSLDRVELLSALEHRYNVEIDEEQFSQARSVEDLRKLVAPVGAESFATPEPREPAPRYHYPRWAQSAPVRLFRLFVYYLLVWPATQILGHPRVYGRENLAAVRGPLIFVSNHITRRADIGLILAALPARFRHRLATAMGGETLLRMRTPPRAWFFGKRWGYRLGYWLVTALFNVFPLPQFSGFRQSFRFAGDSVDRGYSLLIFPEGEVNNSEDGQMAAFQSGIGLLAENLDLEIVPMRLDGVWRMKRERRRLAHRGEITVHIGAPVKFAPGTRPEDVARRLRELVAAL